MALSPHSATFSISEIPSLFSIISSMLSRRVAFMGRRCMSTAPKASEPAMTRVYGGLNDQDRIFTNLYGEGVSLCSLVFV